METKYDPFLRGPFPVGVRTIQANDRARNRDFPCEIWYPAAETVRGSDLHPGKQDSFALPMTGRNQSQSAVRDAAEHSGKYPLILYSHLSGGHRRSSTFLCTHLASHGYIVAAIDHSEVVAPELARKTGESAEEKKARAKAWVASRVPDMHFLLDHLQQGGIETVEWTLIGITGHSFGGWTSLAAVETDSRICAVVAHAPGGASNPRPGILPGILNFDWNRDVPTMYLVAENDVSLPLTGMYELFHRTPATKQMFILRRADHAHFVDNIEELHEFARTMPVPPELAWLHDEMRPFSELCSSEHAHIFVRGLTLSHFDAALKNRREAQEFLAGDVEAQLAARGVEAIEYPSRPPAQVNNAGRI